MILWPFLVTFTCIINKALAEIEGYIVGGERAPINRYPHAVFLDVICSTARTWVCGASIVNQHFTLTAAHCVYECPSTGYISVAVGHEHNQKGVISSAFKYKTHEDYDDMTLAYDIALVRLRTPFTFGPHIKRVILMRKPPRDKEAYIAGWGVIDESRYLSSSWMKHAKVKVWSTEDCMKLLKNMLKFTICAGSDSGEDYAAGGDSGSGLVIKGYVQIGIVSYKEPYLSKNVIVYTDVAHFYNWISRSTRNMFCG